MRPQNLFGTVKVMERGSRVRKIMCSSSEKCESCDAQLRKDAGERRGRDGWKLHLAPQRWIVLYQVAKFLRPHSGCMSDFADFCAACQRARLGTRLASAHLQHECSGIRSVPIHGKLLVLPANNKRTPLSNSAAAEAYMQVNTASGAASKQAVPEIV